MNLAQPYPKQASEKWHAWIIALALFAAMFWGLAVVVAGLAAVLVAVASILSVIVLINFRFGVALMILLIPLSSTNVFPHELFGVTGLNPLNILMLALLGNFFLRLGLNKKEDRIFVPRELWLLYLVPIAFAGLYGALHVGKIASIYQVEQIVKFTSAKGYLLTILLKPVTYMLFAFLVAAAVAKSPRPERLLAPALISICMLAALVVGIVVISGVSLSLLSGSGARNFLSITGMHANELGLLFSTAYALILFSLSASRGALLRLCLMAAAALVTAGLLLTFSRAALLAFLVINAAFLFSRRRTKTLVAGVVVAVCFLVVMPKAFTERATEGFSEGSAITAKNDQLTAGRVGGVWLPLLPEVWRSPLVGNGLSSIFWSDAVRFNRIPPLIHPHNAYLRTLLDMGIIGMILVMMFFAKTWTQFRLLRSDTRVQPLLRGFFEGASVAMIGFAVAAFTNSGFVPAAEHVYIWLAVGMAYGVRTSLALGKGTIAQPCAAITKENQNYVRNNGVLGEKR